jgi:hypothetical protein
MENLEKINFRQSRDFGETFNVSIKFLRQNFKHFFQCLIFIAGPFVLISAIAGAFYQSKALNMSSMLRMGGNPFDTILNQFGWLYLIFVLAAILANLALIGTVFAYMITYMENGPQNFTVSDVGKTITKNIGNILAVFFIFTILIIIALAIIVGIIALAAMAAPALGILLGVAAFFGLLIIFPPMMWQLSVIYLVKMQEGRGVFESYGRTRVVMKGNFWWTWVIMICATFAVGIIAFIFALPQAIFNIVLTFSHLKSGESETSISFLVVATICTFCSTLLYSGLYVISAFHYYSLAEQKDGIGLMERINEIGSTQNNNVEQQY